MIWKTHPYTFKEKHPNLHHVDPSIMKDYNSIPEFVSIFISEDDEENAAKKLSGSRGRSSFDSSALQNMLLHQGQASTMLMYVLTDFSNWLANRFPTWAAYHALMMCQEVAYRKTKGIILFGIGYIIRRCLIKLVVLKDGS